MKLILTNCLGYDENSPMFLYMKKPNCNLDSGLVPLVDAIQDSELILTYTQTYQNQLHVYVSRVELSPLVVADQCKDEVLNINVPTMDFEDMVSYLMRKITKRFTTLYYTLPPNHTLLGIKAIKNDYDTNVIYNIANVAGTLQIYAAQHPIDFSTVLIPNNGCLEKYFACIISEETILKQKKSLRYLHQMQKQNKRFDYFDLLGKLGFIDKTKPTTPYTQTILNFLVHNNGQLVIDDKKDPVYINGGTMNITIPRMKLEEMKQYMSYILGKKINALYYKVPHNGFSITVKLRNNYDMHAMFDISSTRGKLEIYIDHVGVNFIIAKYIYPNATLAEMMNHVITDYTSDSEEERREVTQNDYTFDQVVERAEQEHFEDEELNKFNVIKKYRKIVYHPLIEYGGYALGCMTGADMKKATYMKMVRDELLRSMEEKRQLIKNYKVM
ncbi:hypothetical protein Tco_0484990 [Tanacetum coccineum]